MLTKKEWIAVVVVLVAVAIFFGAKFFVQSPDVKKIDQDLTNGITDNTKNMDQNNQETTASANNNVPSPSALVVKDIIVGTGAEAKIGNLVSVEYTGMFADGKVFDSSIPRGEPIEFTLGIGQVIKGWDQGILGMKVGGHRTLVIPASLGYGAKGFPPVIPGNATLYFDVKLVGVKVQ